MYEDLKNKLRHSSALCIEPLHTLLDEAADAIEKLEIQVNNYRKALDALERSNHVEKLP